MIAYMASIGANTTPANVSASVNWLDAFLVVAQHAAPGYRFAGAFTGPTGPSGWQQVDRISAYRIESSVLAQYRLAWQSLGAASSSTVGPFPPDMPGMTVREAANRIGDALIGAFRSEQSRMRLAGTAADSAESFLSRKYACVPVWGWGLIGGAALWIATSGKKAA